VAGAFQLGRQPVTDKAICPRDQDAHDERSARSRGHLCSARPKPIEIRLDHHLNQLAEADAR
jgi:hypothetical protein